MNDEKVSKIILDEQKFPCENMAKEERNYYLNILRNCKDICDSDNKVDSIGKCEILQMKLVKKENFVTANGTMSISSENRSINAIIFQENDSIIVDMQVTRYFDEGHKAYTVLDQFTIKDNKLVRKSQYNYDMNSTYTEIENEEMKGRLK